ncbi:hypothetical protein TrVE_jg10974 [Triparma verrucosa]|uniref:Calcineurin-like phosphoesterase domain-containing protein n=1 Tax=Triparma verrucosa TaxID=1606542 RepID=A0A9W7FMR7_9STRA|nr:hypothetical protein TrVE_jg10974 [Triparma verrucosa]
MIVLLLLLISAFASAKRTTFWQWTDPHVDLINECAGNKTKGAMFGNFDNSDTGCGCTPALLDSALDHMKGVDSEEGTPDFIFFTGDSPWGSTPIDSEAEIKAQLQKKYPDTPIYFCIGNHDVIGDMNPSGDDNKPLYHDTAELWGDYLDEDAKATFAASGWYSQKISEKVKLVVLNTEYYDYGNDEVLVGNTYVDGYAQYDWLRSELEKSKDAGEKVYLFGHIPPGYECGKFSDITDEFAEVIAVTIHGHEHIDTFRLVGEKSHHYSVPGMTSGYPRKNPSVRLWVHDLEEGEVPDYKQYHFDMINSNIDETPYWKETYVFSKQYGYNNTRREVLEDLLDRFAAEHADPSVSTVFAEHKVFYSSDTPVEYQPICDEWCQVQSLCDMNFGAVVQTFGNMMTTCLAWKGYELFSKNAGEEL